MRSLIYMYSMRGICQKMEKQRAVGEKASPEPDNAGAGEEFLKKRARSTSKNDIYLL